MPPWPLPSPVRECIAWVRSDKYLSSVIATTTNAPSARIRWVGWGSKRVPRYVGAVTQSPHTSSLRMRRRSVVRSVAAPRDAAPWYAAREGRYVGRSPLPNHDREAAGPLWSRDRREVGLLQSRDREGAVFPPLPENTARRAVAHRVAGAWALPSVATCRTNALAPRPAGPVGRSSGIMASRSAGRAGGPMHFKAET